MAKIWADRLMAGTRTWSEVPASRVNDVVAVLQNIANDKNNAKHVLAQEVLDKK